jgi:hypothetical protein
MILALLGWTKLPQWAMEVIFTLLVILIVAGAVWYYGHEHYEAGISAQIATDNAERAKLIAANDKKTADLQARATTAEKAYDDEQTKTANYNASNPLEPIRLCNTATNSGGHLPAAGAPIAGDQSSSSSTAAIQQMSKGNNSLRDGPGGRDISGLLESFAQSADEVSASLREFQTR